MSTTDSFYFSRSDVVWIPAASEQKRKPEGAEHLVFSYLLHFRDVADEGGIVHKVVELLQLTQVLHVILPNDLMEARNQHLHHIMTRRAINVKKQQQKNNLGDELSQTRVAEQQPTSGSDAVGFVLKLFWLQIAEITEAEGERNEE